MFGQFRKLFTNSSFKKTILTFGLAYTSLSLTNNNKFYKSAEQQIGKQQSQQQRLKINQEKDELSQRLKKGRKQISSLKRIRQIQACKSKDVVQGKPYIIKVQDREGKDHLIAIIRYKNKLYGVKGTCPYQDKVQTLVKSKYGQIQKKQIQEKRNIMEGSLQNAIIFNDKLYCPHHGCAYDVQSGSVQYGPSRQNLPRFMVKQQGGIVKVFYPQKLPKKVLPNLQPLNPQDYRKVLILGDDHPAVMGCIDGLKQYGYSGQLTILQRQAQYPYQKHNLHKLIPNFRQKLSLKQRKYIASANQQKTLKQIDKQISKMLQQKVYNKIRYQSPQWYRDLGINFVYSDDTYRLIGKRLYPYLSFYQGMKIEYDGLLAATDTYLMYPIITGLTMSKQRPPNVFMPYKNMKEHQKLIKFLNVYDVKAMSIFGLNSQALQFCQAVINSFPNIKISIFDTNQITTLSQHYGKTFQTIIGNQFKKHGVDFYVHIQQFKEISNRLQALKEDKFFDIDKKQNRNIQKSIRVVFPDDYKVQSDCAVLFTNNQQANTQGLKKGKHLDVQFTKLNKIITDPYCRSDSRRIFGAGNCSSMELFFTKSRMQTNNFLVGYQQGFASALNIQAMNVPYHYIPFQRRKFFDKEFFFSGHPNKQSNNMLILGQIQKWDFLCIYAIDQEIVAVSASPSKQRQFNILRESFRLQCYPQFTQILKDYWTIPNLQILIRKMDKSGCYRDPIKKLQNNIHLADVLWVQRGPSAGYQNDHPIGQDQTPTEVDARGYVRQV